MSIVAAFVVALAVLLVALVAERLDRRFKAHDGVVGASGFWVVLLGVAIIAQTIAS